MYQSPMSLENQFDKAPSDILEGGEGSIRKFFAPAEEGMPEIPDTLDISEFEKETGMSFDQYFKERGSQ